MIAIAVDAILALVVLETAVLIAFHHRTARGIAPRRLLGNLAAGFCLLLALRLNLEPGRGASWNLATALVLFFALVAHLLDLASRWKA